LWSPPCIIRNRRGLVVSGKRLRWCSFDFLCRFPTLVIGGPVGASSSTGFFWYNSLSDLQTMSTGKLQGKTALITGGSKGLGRAMAVALAAEGASLALVSRDRAKLESVADEARAIYKNGGAGNCEARVFVADVAREADVARLREEVLAAF